MAPTTIGAAGLETSSNSTLRMPELSLATSVTGSDPLRAPPASIPDASTVTTGAVGSLIVTSLPCRMWLMPPPAATEQSVGRLKQPTRKASVVASPL